MWLWVNRMSQWFFILLYRWALQDSHEKIPSEWGQCERNKVVPMLLNHMQSSEPKGPVHNLKLMRKGTFIWNGSKETSRKLRNNNKILLIWLQVGLVETLNRVSSPAPPLSLSYLQSTWWIWLRQYLLLWQAIPRAIYLACRRTKEQIGYLICNQVDVKRTEEHKINWPSTIQMSIEERMLCNSFSQYSCSTTGKKQNTKVVLTW